jgi:hypothetical protein
MHAAAISNIPKVRKLPICSSFRMFIAELAARSDAPNGIWFNTKPGGGR